MGESGDRRGGSDDGGESDVRRKAVVMCLGGFVLKVPRVLDGMIGLCIEKIVMGVRKRRLGVEVGSRHHLHNHFESIVGKDLGSKFGMPVRFAFVPIFHY